MAFASVGWYVPDETWQSVEIAHGIVWPGINFPCLFHDSLRYQMFYNRIWPQNLGMGNRIA